MELSLFTKIKITATLAVGGLLLGFVAWPMVAPETAYGQVAFLNDNVSFADIFLLSVLSLFAGFVSGLISKPYNKQIAALAAPAGLAVLALRSGSMTSLLKSNASASLQNLMYSRLKWESFLWIIVILAGIIGAVMSNVVSPGKADDEKLIEKQILLPKKGKSSSVYLNIFASIVFSLIISHIIIRFLARDVVIEGVSANLVAQPENLQVCFAVFVGFLAAAFVVKLFWSTSYIWVIAAGAIISFVEMHMGGRLDLLESQINNWPIGFFYRPNASILPIQYIAFSSLGAVVGYWWAIRFAWWRKYNV